MTDFQLSNGSACYCIDAFIKIVSQRIPKELFREVFGDREDWKTDIHAKYPYYSMYENSNFNGVVLFRRMENDFDPNSVNDKEQLFEALKQKSGIRFNYNAAKSFAKFVGRVPSDNWTKEISEFILYADSHGYCLPTEVFLAFQEYVVYCRMQRSRAVFRNFLSFTRDSETISKNQDKQG